MCTHENRIDDYKTGDEICYTVIFYTFTIIIIIIIIIIIVIFFIIFYFSADW